jgi:uncharacterized membrane protein YfcA
MFDMLTLGLISVIVGFLGSLIGLGGGMILIPIMSFFGVPLKEAIAAAMASIVATSSGSASAFVKSGLSNIKIAMFLEVFTITGAILGATVTAIIPAVYLYFFFSAFLLTSFLGFKQFKNEYRYVENQDKFSKWLGLQGRYFDASQNRIIDYKATHALLGGGGMFIAGIAAGMLGIGAGAFKVTVQDNILKMPPKVSSATSNFIIGMTALAATSVYLYSGLINLTLVAPIAVGTTIGSIIGGRTLNKLNNKIIKVIFYLIVSLMIGQMIYKGITAL